jgi:hypothetical protein
MSHASELTLLPSIWWPAVDTPQRKEAGIVRAPGLASGNETRLAWAGPADMPMPNPAAPAAATPKTLRRLSPCTATVWSVSRLDGMGLFPIWFVGRPYDCSLPMQQKERKRSIFIGF